jgi:hypothetical protein
MRRFDQMAELFGISKALIEKARRHWKNRYAKTFLEKLHYKASMRLRYNSILLKRMQKTFFLWKIRKVAHRRHITSISKPFHMLRILSRVHHLFATWFDSNALPILRTGFRKIHTYKDHCESCFKKIEKSRHERLTRNVFKFVVQLQREHKKQCQKSLRRAYLRFFVRPLIHIKLERSSACRRQLRRWADRQLSVSDRQKEVDNSGDVFNRRSLRSCMNKMSMYTYAVGYQNACLKRAIAATQLIQLLRSMQHWQHYQTRRTSERSFEQIDYYAVISFWRFSRRVKQLEAQRSLIEVADNFCDEFICKKYIKLWYRRMKRNQSTRGKLVLSENFYRQKNQSFAFMVLSSISQ